MLIGDYKKKCSHLRRTLSDASIEIQFNSTGVFVVEKKRRPVIAGLLSLVMPGLGHMYAGDLRKGLAIIGLLYGVIICGGLFGLYSTFYGIAAAIIVSLSCYVYALLSSVGLAARSRVYRVKGFNRWYWYLTFFISASLVANVLSSYRAPILGYETYRIPAQSMHPALQVGDFITTDTRYSEAKVGDVVVFFYPRDKRLVYVKRVVALGGDTVAIENGLVVRNGVPQEFVSIAEGNRKLDISRTMREFKVPQNEVFVLGDWRDNSNDSRFWGPVPESDVVGKVTYIWYASDFSRIGTAVE